MCMHVCTYGSKRSILVGNSSETIHMHTFLLLISPHSHSPPHPVYSLGISYMYILSLEQFFPPSLHSSLPHASLSSFLHFFILGNDLLLTWSPLSRLDWLDVQLAPGICLSLPPLILPLLVQWLSVCTWPSYASSGTEGPQDFRTCSANRATSPFPSSDKLIFKNLNCILKETYLSANRKTNSTCWKSLEVNMMILKQFYEFNLDSVTTQLTAIQNSECSQARRLRCLLQNQVDRGLEGVTLSLWNRKEGGVTSINTHQLHSSSIAFALFNSGGKNSRTEGGEEARKGSPHCAQAGRARRAWEWGRPRKDKCLLRTSQLTIIRKWSDFFSPSTDCFSKYRSPGLNAERPDMTPWILLSQIPEQSPPGTVNFSGEQLWARPCSELHWAVGW